MKKTYWKIILTIACLVLAGAIMISGKNAEASEDPAGPSVRLEMEEGNLYDGSYYYRRDNCGISLSVSDEGSALEIVELMIDQTVFQLSDCEMISDRACVLTLDAGQISDLVEQDGTVLVSVYAEDATGDQTVLQKEFILDGTNPKAIITYASGKPFFLYPDGEGEEVYVAADVTAKVAYEDNCPLDYDRIALEEDGVRLASLTEHMSDDLYQCEWKEEKKHTLATYGCDVAGNPLEVTEIVDAAGEFQAGACPEAYEPHCRIMIDSTMPAVTITVSDSDGEIFYQVSANGEKTVVERYQPFRRGEMAKVQIRCDELSPFKMSYAVGSTLGGQEREVADPEWNDSDERIFRETLFGQQAFWLDALHVTDKAGNGFSLGKSNRLYLDTEGPTVTISLPEPVTTATREITKRDANGQGLYRSDVVLQVTVNDYQMEQAGAGLSQVLCCVKVNGSACGDGDAYVSRLTDCLKDAPDYSWPRQIASFSGQVIYGDDQALAACRSSYRGTITIPKGDVFESNNIEVTVTAADNAGNMSDPAQGGTAVFGIDSEGPAAEVVYDNQEAQNESYFKEARTAQIRITDRNIDSSKIVIDTEPAVPAAFAYSKGSDPAGNDDLFSKQITYAEDGKYTLQISGTDALGNPFRQEVKYRGTAPTSFVIDRTAPEIVFEQVEDGTAYRGKIAPRILFKDENASEDLISLTLTGKRGEDRSDLIPPFAVSETGGSYDLQNIEITEQNDDIYMAVAKMKDLAGNEAEQSIGFSVNRFGSTYDYNGDKHTEAFLAAYFSNQEQTLYLREININDLTDHKITLYRDGVNQVLKQGADYRLTEKDYGGAKQYIYEIYAGNFKKEGIYDIGVQSVDKAGNTNSNRAVKHALKNQSAVRSGENSEVPLKFAIDKTPPQIQINGTDIRKAQVFSDDQAIRIMPYDNMNLRSVRMELLSKPEGASRLVGTYQGTELSEKLDENEGVLSFAFDPEDGQKQMLLIEACDAAGNVYSGNVYFVSPKKRTVFRKTSASPGESTRGKWWILVMAAGVGAGGLIAGRKKRRE